MGRNKEQSARMLGHLVSNAPRLIRPYMEPILKVSYSRAVYLYITCCFIPVSVNCCIFCVAISSLASDVPVWNMVGLLYFTVLFSAASLITSWS